MSTKVTYRGQKVTLEGNTVKVGDLAPEVELVGYDFSLVKVGGKRKRKQVLFVVPSVEGDISGEMIKETHKELYKSDWYSLTDIFVVSMDLPFAFVRYGTENNITRLRGLSDFRTKEFSKKYGVLQSDGFFEGLLCRAVFVVGTDGKIIYKEIAPEVSKHLDHEKLKESIK